MDLGDHWHEEEEEEKGTKLELNSNQTVLEIEILPSHCENVEDIPDHPDHWPLNAQLMYPLSFSISSTFRLTK